MSAAVKQFEKYIKHYDEAGNLVSVVIPNTVTRIASGALAGRSSLKRVEISGSVKRINWGAFQNCSSLTDVVIPDSVTVIDSYAFEGCSSLTIFVVPDSVTSIGMGAFKNCSSLKSAIIPDNVTSIGMGAFENCSSLTSVVIPDSVKSIGRDVFKGCTNLKGVAIPESTSETVPTFAYRTSAVPEKIKEELASRLIDYSFQNLKTNFFRTKNHFLEKSEKFLFEYKVTVNGKTRNIVTYKDNTEGTALRHTHEYFVYCLKKLHKPSTGSYAYKEGTNVVACLERHLSSDVFLKMDIHSYFESVKKDILKDKACRLSEKNSSVIADFIDGCFYQNRMPIGLVSSPILSDIYLKDLDTVFDSREDIVYTRYADDLIISTKGEDAEERLAAVRTSVKAVLKELDLELNTKKTYIRRLAQPGDAIHLLGLNVVKTESETNRITVSDGYIREVSKEFCDLYDRRNGMDADTKKAKLLEVSGKIQYIVHASESSAKKLKKMLFVKKSIETELDYKSLADLLEIEK